MTTPLSSIGAPAASAAPAGAGSGDGGLRKAAESFEAVILRQLLSSMRQAKLGDDIFGSSATDNFREMADAKTADSIASMRQFGIADMVEAQFRARVGGAQ
ncbi:MULTISPECIES: rod-binding protein [Sphingopyxis]|jgi:flagellar protein FlgJ|uniref:rod-binding protein n=1 Tax=Sphingopyxis TaxID=165697 RepID=UPI0002D1ADE4|nr:MULTISPECIES: rod-binding protein [Sphingopyxis]ENY82188.1 peptidoglycan hydrolase [Sphingopyxis sp. MC1]KAB2856922.1 MAG: peptidoglycan hydrolase [Sphingopyxis terrae]MBD3745790.1 rod-binding protein [Sphingopyxis terrae]MBN8804659.1 rod-binding protein [Sphingopyxis terrae]MDX8356298.1 rod-binding protein [Sphingopyxis terrae]